jgi:hypothetical protein
LNFFLLDPDKEIPWPGRENWDVNTRYLTFEPDEGGFNNSRIFSL